MVVLDENYKNMEFKKNIFPFILIQSYKIMLNVVENYDITKL